MIRRFYENHETAFCMVLIGAYVAVNSFSIQNFGTEDFRSVLINLAFAAALLALTVILGKTGFYGLRPARNRKECLYFLPLVLIASVNLWSGFRIRSTPAQILCHILMMLNVGFSEEMIFRGFLFRMMEKENLRRAMVVSAITFGMGHIVNLLNGAPLVSTLLQLCYAAAIGWVFVVVLCRSGSILPCIAAHGVLNALSIFSAESILPDYVISAILIAVSLGYAAYIEHGTKQ